ncbi:MAG: CheR family methyltransferase [Cellvibrionaceae bacterium]
MIWSFKKPDSLPQQQFFLWENLLEKRTGVQLAQPQHILLQTQVSIRMRELGIDSYDQYFDYVKDDAKGIAEWQVLVDRLVVKETTFFRHRPSLGLVKKFLRNRLSSNEAKASNEIKDSIEIWSVGCSTGEEPYALAAIANDCFYEREMSPYFGVTAVDISLPALSIAREGVYGRRSVSLLSEAEIKRYLKPYKEGKYQVIEQIKKRVCFSQLNLLYLKNKPFQPMDVIFCQNVLIYFRRWRRREILNELVKHLKPGGILVIGLGEVTDWEHPDMQRIAHEESQAYVKC